VSANRRRSHPCMEGLTIIVRQRANDCTRDDGLPVALLVRYQPLIGKLRWSGVWKRQYCGDDRRAPNPITPTRAGLVQNVHVTQKFAESYPANISEWPNPDRSNGTRWFCFRFYRRQTGTSRDRSTARGFYIILFMFTVEQQSACARKLAGASDQRRTLTRWTYRSEMSSGFFSNSFQSVLTFQRFRLRSLPNVRLG